MIENELTFDIEADELDIFLDEVNEHLQVMESGILRLEQSADANTLNSVFRAAHTIKALAGTVGHHRMADLTHAMENLFDVMRGGQLTPTQDTVDELFAVVDILKILRDEIASQQASHVDVSTVLAQLHALVDNDGQGVASSNESERALTPAQITQIKHLQEERQSVLEIEVSTSPRIFAPAARLMQAAMALMDAGQIINQHPTMDELANNQHNGDLWLILASESDIETIEELLAEVSELAKCQVQPFQVDQPAMPAPAATPRNELSTDKTVRISVERLDALMNLVGELVTNRNRLMRVEDTLRAQYSKEDIVSELGESSAHLERVVDKLQEEVMRARMLPISHLFDKFPRIVRDVARTAGKQVDLIIEGATTELDRSLIEAIGDPLIHLLRNAVDHGIELAEVRTAAGKPPTGTVRLTAAHAEGQIVITVEDDGRGIDPARVRQAAVSRELLTEEHAVQLSDDETIDLIFEPSLSTAEKLTGVSGRGVGMDVVRTNVERLSGAVVVESELGRGTTFRVTLPLTLAIVETMLVQLWDAVYAIPLTSINDVLYLSEVKINTITGNQAIRWRDSVLPLIDLRQFFADPRRTDMSVDGAKRAIVSVTWGKQRSGLVVDKIIGKQGIVVKSLSPIIGDVPGLSGGTILGDGHIALILDVPSLMNAALRSRRQGTGA